MELSRSVALAGSPSMWPARSSAVKPRVEKKLDMARAPEKNETIHSVIELGDDSQVEHDDVGTEGYLFDCYNAGSCATQSDAMLDVAGDADDERESSPRPSLWERRLAKLYSLIEPMLSETAVDR